MKKRKGLQFPDFLLRSVFASLFFFLSFNGRAQYIHLAQNKQYSFLHKSGFFGESKVDSTKFNIIPVWESVVNLSVPENEANTTFILSHGIDYHSSSQKKLRFSATFTNNIASFYPNFSLRADSLKSIPGYGPFYAANSNIFYWLHFEGGIDYSLFDFLTLTIGNKKRFAGPGHRSLLLSDYAPPFPYVGINVNSEKLSYDFSLGYLKDLYNDEYKAGYTVMHGLEAALTDWLDVFLFETIMWRHQDSSLHRGLDINYLNPVIFFRPVEYSIGSPDNVLVGLGINIKPAASLVIYSQFMLDEFVSKDFLKNTSFTNKYAFQAGSKYLGNFKNIGMQLLAEYNLIRPYTYSHYSTLQNYGNRQYPLAHPFGANLVEKIGGVRLCVPHGKSYFSAIVHNLEIGLDAGNENNGADIYKNYGQNTEFYGNELLQGNKTNAHKFEINLGHVLVPKWRLTTEISFSKIKNPVLGIDAYYFSAGIKTLLFNNDFYF